MFTTKPFVKRWTVIGDIRFLRAAKVIEARLDANKSWSLPSIPLYFCKLITLSAYAQSAEIRRQLAIRCAEESSTTRKSGATKPAARKIFRDWCVCEPVGRVSDEGGLGRARPMAGAAPQPA